LADRTVNVRINYVVSTADIQKATAASLQAQKATDTLRKTTEDYGKAATQANKQVSDSLKKTQQDTNSLSKEFSNLYTSVKLFLTAGLVRELVDASLNFAKLSGQVEGVSKAFNRLPNATLLLEDLRKSTHGTVTDLALMQRALTAQNYKIPLQNLGKLLEFAAVKAQQTGQEVNHLVDYIVSGIGLRSIKRLDDLGFTANRVKEALGGISLQAADMGQVVGAVTKLMAEDLDKTGGFVETSKTKVEQLEVAWQSLQVTVAKRLTSSGLVNLFQALVENFEAGISTEDELIQKEAKIAAIKQLRLFQERALTEDILKDKQKTYDVIQQEANTLQQNIGRNNDELRNARERLKALNGLTTGETDRNKLYGERFSLEGKSLNQRRLTNIQFAKTVEKEKEELADQIDFYRIRNYTNSETIKILLEYNKALNIGTQDEKEQLGIVSAKRKELELINEQIEDSTRKGDLGATGTLIVKQKKIQQELDDLLGKSKDKQKKTANEVQEYLAYLSELEMFQVKSLLKERQEGREKEAEEEKKAAEKHKKLEEEKAKHDIELRQMVAMAGLNIIQEQLNSIVQADLSSYDTRIRSLQTYYDNQIEYAKDNKTQQQELRRKEDVEIRQLEKQRGDREKKAAEAGIIVNTALGVMKVFAGEGTYIDKIIRAAIVAAEGASQYAIAARARYYSKGGINIPGPGSETSDSIPAFLSRGESIMTAQETRKSFGLLTAIRNNKMDDNILKKIDFSGGRQVAVINDERVVKELQEIRKGQTDLEYQFGVLYKATRDSEGNKKKQQRFINA
jgi:hypothetical protein